MLEYLLTSKTKEQILMFLTARNEGYAREIARFYNKSLSLVQKQLDNLEYGGVLVNKKAGKTILYYFNPRYFLINELKIFINKALEYLPEKEKESLLNIRRRPRRKGKPL